MSRRSPPQLRTHSRTRRPPAHPPTPPGRTGVLGLLRQVFAGDVASYKPRSCHVHVGSYYLVCTNFDPVRAYQMQVGWWWGCRWGVGLCA